MTRSTASGKTQSRQASSDWYLARPTSGATSGGVLVLHAWWGLNPFFHSLCDRLAAEGFAALAPDLYHGTLATTVDEAERLRSKLKGTVAQSEILQAVTALSAEVGGKPIAVMGFSMGAYYALWLVEQAALPVTATVLFYGTRGGDYAATPSAFLGHFAESDEWVAASGVKKLEKALRAAGKEVDFHTYPGTSHWFFESDRPDAFSPQAADLAWQRTVAFLHRLVS